MTTLYNCVQYCLQRYLTTLCQGEIRQCCIIYLAFGQKYFVVFSSLGLKRISWLWPDAYFSYTRLGRQLECSQAQLVDSWQVECSRPSPGQGRQHLPLNWNLAMNLDSNLLLSPLHTCEHSTLVLHNFFRSNLIKFSKYFLGREEVVGKD